MSTLRWTRTINSALGGREEHPKVDAFLEEIVAVCRKHNLSIAHEDGHGSFEIEPLDEYNLRWLMDAGVLLEAKK